MTKTVTTSSRDLGITLTPPQNLIQVTVKNHLPFLDYEAVVEGFDAAENLADVRDLEITKQLYETAGITAFTQHRAQHEA